MLATLRAPYRGRSTPVNAWWGTFDLAVSLFSGRSVDPPSNDFIMRNSANAEQIEIGWWPGDARYPRAAFFAFAYPPQAGLESATVSPTAAHWDAELGEYILDWDDARSAPDPHAVAVEFGRSIIRHACAVCNWDSTWRPAPKASLRRSFESPHSPARQVSRRSSSRTVMRSPSCFWRTRRSSVLMGNLWLPSPSAMNELRNG